MIHANKIFGIGLNKTGTKTLGKCFEILGLTHKSYDFALLKAFAQKDYQSIFKISDEYDSFEDWPWPLLYKEFDKEYPNAKFILTTRLDSETWFRSLYRHSLKTGPTEARKIVFGYYMPMENPDHHKLFYDNYNLSVLNYFIERPSKLLCVSWEAGDEWDRLCSFLDKPVPNIPFPHVNKT
jgi:hypothetical protein